MSATLTCAVVQHRSQSRIALNFDYNPDWHQRIKKVPGARWSRTMKSWHVPDTIENRVKCRITSGEATATDTTTTPESTFTRGVILPAVYVPAHTICTKAVKADEFALVKKPIITVKPLYHRNGEHMAMHFKPCLRLNTIIKQLPGIKHSTTHQCWYLPCNRQNYQSLLLAIAPVALADSRKLKEYLLQKQALVHDAHKPVHKSTLNIIQQYPLYPHNLQALQAYRNMLVVTKYSQSTIEQYCNAFHQLLRLLGPTHIDVFDRERILKYMVWLVETKNYSETNLNTTINALKFYFEKVLGRDREYYDLPRPRATHKLPDVLAEEEVVTLIQRIKNIKHRALIMTSYSAGLRVSDMVGLKV